MARTAYFAQSSATATIATAVFTTAVDFNNTPPDNSSVLYIGSVEVLASTANTPYEMRMRNVTGSSTLSTTHYIASGVTSAIQKLANGFDIVTYGASPGAQTITMEVRSCAAVNGLQRSNAYLFGIVLSSNDSFIRGSSTFVSASGDTWTTVGSQLDVSVATSGRFIIMSYAESSAHQQGGTGVSAQGTRFRVVVDGSAKEAIQNYRAAASAMITNFIYMGMESWTAGAHRINLQAAWGGGAAVSGLSKVNNVRHVALEVASFTTAYATADNIAVSGSSLSFTTVKSFTADVTQSASHAILAYYMFGSEASTGSSQQSRSIFLFNGENLSENSQTVITQPGSVAGHIVSPGIIALTQNLTAVSHNISLQAKLDAATADFCVINNAVAILQLADASVGGGPTTTPKTVEAVGRGVATVIKTVGANRVAIGRAVANSQKTVNIRREAVTTGVARANTQEIVNQLSAAVAVANASIARNSQFRLTLESVGRAIASISNPAVRSKVLEAVTRAIAEISSRTTRVKDLVAFANHVATVIKTVGKPLEVVGRGFADSQIGFFSTHQAKASAIATLNDATVVTASTGTAAVVTANPYVLSLGESVKRFRSLIQHGAGLGRGTTSDRDPDS